MGDGRYGVFEIEKTFKEQKMRRIVAIALVSLGISGCGYNTIQTNDEAAVPAQQQISVKRRRGAAQMGNMVETVKGQAKQELEVFTQVARARAGITSAIQSGDAGEMANANDQLTGAGSGVAAQGA